MRKISFYTFGCRLNQAETAVMQNSLAAEGYTVVAFGEPADIVVVNTCTVTENGDADTRRLVNKINRQNPQVRIALVGCQAQVQKNRLANLPNVSWVVGNARKFDLAEIFEAAPFPKFPQVIAPTIPREDFTIPVAGIASGKTRANLKIQDGCDFFCSFCEIPFARGRARSRKFENILEEVEGLTAVGHKEIILTGINLGTYQQAGKNILQVIEAMERNPKIERIRISSIEPTTIPVELIARMAQGSKLCRHLHIPLQSGHDAILNRMQRKYSLVDFLKFIEHAHRTVPEICIGTDLIVGFPGETDEHFQATYRVLRDSPIHYAHVFSYSKRTMAKSRNFSEAIPAEIIQERSQTLRELSYRKRQGFYATLLGTTQRVLFETKKEGGWTGLTDHYARVTVDSQENLANQIRSVQLMSLSRTGMWGEIFSSRHYFSSDKKLCVS